MTKLSKQDKIDIFHLWQNYQVGATELSRRYQVMKQYPKASRSYRLLKYYWKLYLKDRLTPSPNCL